MISKEEMRKQLLKDQEKFLKMGGLIDYKKARKIKPKKSVWVGTNRKQRVQELRGWEAVVPSANASYGFGGWYAEWKESE